MKEKATTKVNFIQRTQRMIDETRREIEKDN